MNNSTHFNRKNSTARVSVPAIPSPVSTIRKQSLNQQTWDMSQRFRYLTDVQKFIQNDHIKKLKNEFNQMKINVKNNKDNIAQFSKSIYKKVISRDNDFQFGLQAKTQKYYDLDPIKYFNNQYSKSGQPFMLVQKYDKTKLQRSFKHQNIVTAQQKLQRLRQQQQIPLNFQHVKLIDTKQFQKYKDVQFYDILTNYNDEPIHSNNELNSLSIQAHLQSLKHNLIQKSQYHSKLSYNFIFDCNRDLYFWKINAEQVKDDAILSNCAFLNISNVSIYDMLDFASRNIQIDDIVRFSRLKKQLHKKMEQDKNNQSLQQKFNQAKKRFEQMKQNRLKTKSARIPAKFVNNEVQTSDKMMQKDFDDYFVTDASEIYQRLKMLNQVRDRMVIQQEGQTFNVMATNIGIQIGKQLFKLLMLVLKGQDLSAYSQFFRADNESMVQRTILQVIYLNFANFKQHQVNGESKTSIIKRYLEERQKNQRFYQTYSLKNETKLIKK